MPKVLLTAMVSLAAIAAGVAILYAQTGAEEEATKTVNVKAESDPQFIDVIVPVAEQILEFAVEKDIAGEVAVGEVKVTSEDGAVKVVAHPEVKHDRVVEVLSRVKTHQVADAAAREALEKVARDLEQKADELQKQGRQEAAEQVRQSMHAIRQLLEPGRAGHIAFGTGGKAPAVERQIIARVEKGPLAAEMQKVQAHMQELRARLKSLESAEKPEAAEARERVAAEIKELEKRLAETKKSDVILNLKTPGAPELPRKTIAKPVLPGVVAQNRPFIFHNRKIASPEIEELSRKADALRSAAAKLKEAGLGDQARSLAEQAEKVEQEAEKLRARSFEVSFTNVDHPPFELHRSIQELREQVQALRGEVGELRKLLEKKQ